MTNGRTFIPAPDGWEDRDVAERMKELEKPHIVVTYDPTLRTYSCSGPYPTALTASIAAEQEAAEHNAGLAEGDLPWEFYLALLHPPHQGRSQQR